MLKNFGLLVEQIEQEFKFRGFGRAGGEASEDESNAGLVAGFALLEGFLSQDPGRFDELRVVEQDKSLLRRTGGGASHGAVFAGRGIERGHVRHRGRSLANGVQTAAVKIVAHTLMVSGTHRVAFAPEIAGQIGADRRAAQFFVHETTGEQDSVANHFCGQSLRWAASEENVFGISFREIGAKPRVLAISGAEHHLPERGLDVPSGVDEIASQPIKQFGMAGLGALRSEIFRGEHESPPKEHLPKTIHGHPRGQRMMGIGEPLRETEAVFGGISWKGGKKSRS